MAFLTDISTNNNLATVTGNVSADTSIFKFGGGSAFFPNATQIDDNRIYIGQPNSNPYWLALGDGDFTVECWVYYLEGMDWGNATVISSITDILNSQPGQWGLFINANQGTATFSMVNKTLTTEENHLSANNWYHLAACRHNGTVNFYVNGVPSAYSSVVLNDLTYYDICIGQDISLNSAYRGYIDDIRITKGVARYTTNFTPPTAQFLPPYDPYIDYVSLLIHADNCDQSEVYDFSTHALPLTCIGIYVSTEPKIGPGSIEFNNINQKITTVSNPVFNFDSDYTVELWARHSSFVDRSDNPRIISFENATKSWALIAEAGNEDGNLYWRDLETNASIAALNCIPYNDWYHVAIVKSGIATRLYVNGVQQGGNLAGTSMPDPADGDVQVALGASVLNYPYAEFIGYIDEVRITKGVARYTGNFLPQTAPFANPALNKLFADSWAFWNMNKIYSNHPEVLAIMDNTFKNHNMYVVNPVQLVPGKMGNCVNFSGGFAVVTVGFGGNPSFPTQARAFSMWIYRNAISLQNETFIRCYASKKGGSITTYFNVFFDNANDVLNINENLQINNFSDYLPTGTWGHLVITLNDAGVLKVFLNNNQLGLAEDVFIDGLTSLLRFGETLDGKLDAIGVWGRALSTQEIAQLYNNGNGIEP